MGRNPQGRPGKNFRSSACAARASACQPEIKRIANQADEAPGAAMCRRGALEDCLIETIAFHWESFWKKRGIFLNPRRFAAPGAFAPAEPLHRETALKRVRGSAASCARSGSAKPFSGFAARQTQQRLPSLLRAFGPGAVMQALPQAVKACPCLWRAATRHAGSPRPVWPAAVLALPCCRSAGARPACAADGRAAKLFLATRG